MTKLTILMPCLNEAATIERCIKKAQSFLEKSRIEGEVLVADNGSSDSSIDIAKKNNVRVIHISEKGYGATLLGGVKNSKGKYIIFADSDDSYDFSNLQPFIIELERGFDLVIGNRFKGLIKKGAMPILHKYFGNPVLSFLGRIFFKSKIGDFHSGIRAFKKEKILNLNLNSSGMEFSVEMIARATLENLKITEIPTTLSPDGRKTTSSHLKTWEDGWRHLVFMLLYSPRWLFYYTGITFFILGLIFALTTISGTFKLDVLNIELDIFTLFGGCILCLVGMQSFSFGILVSHHADKMKIVPLDKKNKNKFVKNLNLKYFSYFSIFLLMSGLAGIIFAFKYWSSLNFGKVDIDVMARILIPSGTFIAMSLQLAITTFLASFMNIKYNKKINDEENSSNR
jgi:glycosyltransferase involved in cell wall biosynthesis